MTKNQITAETAIEYYRELASLDAKLRAMKTKPLFGKTQLQKVIFYQCTSTFSGPTDYSLRHRDMAVSRNVIADMELERKRIVGCLASLGFEAPKFMMGH